jgi:hypothetical protein
MLAVLWRLENLGARFELKAVCGFRVIPASLMTVDDTASTIRRAALYFPILTLNRPTSPRGCLRLVVECAKADLKTYRSSGEGRFDSGKDW